MMLLSAYPSAAAALREPPLAQFKFVFQPLSNSHTPQAFPSGTKLQKVSSPYVSVSKIISTSFNPQLPPTLVVISGIIL